MWKFLITAAALPVRAAAFAGAAFCIRRALGVKVDALDVIIEALGAAHDHLALAEHALAQRFVVAVTTGTEAPASSQQVN